MNERDRNIYIKDYGSIIRKREKILKRKILTISRMSMIQKEELIYRERKKKLQGVLKESLIKTVKR